MIKPISAAEALRLHEKSIEDHRKSEVIRKNQKNRIDRIPRGVILPDNGTSLELLISLAAAALELKENNRGRERNEVNLIIKRLTCESS